MTPSPLQSFLSHRGVTDAAVDLDQYSLVLEEVMKGPQPAEHVAKVLRLLLDECGVTADDLGPEARQYMEASR